MKKESPTQGVFISGLPVYSCKDEIEYLFSRFGQVKYVRIFSHKSGKKNQSFAKVKFENEESVALAIKQSDKLWY
jgi:RNA recognition motif-containing protein